MKISGYSTDDCSQSKRLAFLSLGCPSRESKICSECGATAQTSFYMNVSGPTTGAYGSYLDQYEVNMSKMDSIKMQQSRNAERTVGISKTSELPDQ